VHNGQQRAKSREGERERARWLHVKRTSSVSVPRWAAETQDEAECLLGTVLTSQLDHNAKKAGDWGDGKGRMSRWDVRLRRESEGGRV